MYPTTQYSHVHSTHACNIIMYNLLYRLAAVLWYMIPSMYCPISLYTAPIFCSNGASSSSCPSLSLIVSLRRGSALSKLCIASENNFKELYTSPNLVYN